MSSTTVSVCHVESCQSKHPQLSSGKGQTWCPLVGGSQNVPLVHEGLEGLEEDLVRVLYVRSGPLAVFRVLFAAGSVMGSSDGRVVRRKRVEVAGGSSGPPNLHEGQGGARDKRRDNFDDVKEEITMAVRLHIVGVGM